jgi:hypothetical protein
VGQCIGWKKWDSNRIFVGKLSESDTSYMICKRYDIRVVRCSRIWEKEIDLWQLIANVVECMKLSRDHVKWVAVMSAVLNNWVLLLGSQLAIRWQVFGDSRRHMQRARRCYRSSRDSRGSKLGFRNVLSFLEANVLKAKFLALPELSECLFYAWLGSHVRSEASHGDLATFQSAHYPPPPPKCLTSGLAAVWRITEKKVRWMQFYA